MAGNSAADCLREPLVDELPTKCQQLKRGYGDCKRGMIDMRKRFRGNKPVGSTPGSDGDANYKSGVGNGMLYANIGSKITGGQEMGVGWSAEEDARRGAAELVPDRFKDYSSGSMGYAAGYVPPAEAAVKRQEKVQEASRREGSGWSWWR